ncbi:hypothetical protein [Anabaena azotica]|uniref:Uncharacterized protein n=1 Tax=Anabaena azotica FACHB-119 TaxID=947527 RepID=A0ABR8D6V4_9NOST|nr:hypothetical protein [Anabaena azotica]MBD2501967.1 hypothetical protein [Anabaena azotica FACHB-119]
MMAQLQQYLGENLDTSSLNQPTQQPQANREPIKHLLIGSPKAVTSTIHYLQLTLLALKRRSR